MQQKHDSEVSLDTRLALQRLARLQTIRRLEADILADMQVCEIEGWDKMEYINQLRDLLNGFGGRYGQLHKTG